MTRPLAVDLFCGLGGWTDGLLAEGYDVIGFDVEQHVYGEHRYPGLLVIQDVLTLHGSQFKNAALIVASPPCQEYSYMAMPWKKAKALAAEYRSGKRDVKRLTALFDACFRIQREACEASGRHIPLIVENVRGAIPWVGRSRWNFGSFHLWGDVPALMPTTLTASKLPGFRFDGSGRPFQSASVELTGRKSQGLNWSDQTKRGQDFTRVAGRQAMEGIKGIPHRTKGHWTNPAEHGVKNGGDWFGSGTDFSLPRHYSGTKRPGVKLSEVGFNVSMAREIAADLKGAKYARSAEDRRQHLGINRRAASAIIAKIPLPLSRHIAATFKVRVAA